MTEVAPNSQQQHIINKNQCYQLSNGSFDRDRWEWRKKRAKLTHKPKIIGELNGGGILIPCTKQHYFRFAFSFTFFHISFYHLIPIHFTFDVNLLCKKCFFHWIAFYIRIIGNFNCSPRINVAKRHDKNPSGNECLRVKLFRLENKIVSRIVRNCWDLGEKISGKNECNIRSAGQKWSIQRCKVLCEWNDWARGKFGGLFWQQLQQLHNRFRCLLVFPRIDSKVAGQWRCFIDKDYLFECHAYVVWWWFWWKRYGWSDRHLWNTKCNGWMGEGIDSAWPIGQSKSLSSNSKWNISAMHCCHRTIEC